MKRRKIVIFCFVLIIGTLLLLIFKINSVFEIKQNVKRTTAQLPQFELYSLDSLKFNIQQHGLRPILLVFFNSECESCGHELQRIDSMSYLFKDISVVLISSESLSTIRSYSNLYSFGSLDNFRFAKIEHSQLVEMLGSFSYPHYLLYGSDGNLIRRAFGIISPTELTGYLNKGKK